MKLIFEGVKFLRWKLSRRVKEGSYVLFSLFS